MQQQLAGLVRAKCAGTLDPLAMLCARKYQDCFRSYAVEKNVTAGMPAAESRPL